MKIIHQNQTEKIRNSAGCVALEYDLGDKNINGAIIELTGREPDAGRVTNLECKELVYIINGSGKVVIEGKEINLQAGDLILIEPGEKFFWEGEMTMFISCAPAWQRFQHQKVD